MGNSFLEKLAKEGDWNSVFKVLGVNPNGVFQMDEIEASDMNSNWDGFDWLHRHNDTMWKLKIVYRLFVICDRMLFVVFLFYLFSYIYKLIRYKFFAQGPT